jgi:predicted methyltransferase
MFLVNNEDPAYEPDNEYVNCDLCENFIEITCPHCSGSGQRLKNAEDIEKEFNLHLNLKEDELRDASIC